MSTVEQRAVFDRVADLYDRARPGYPDALFDRVAAYAELASGARVLEVGCGTGQATRSFARRGLRMTCLEPGANLAALARERLAGCRDVEIAVETFEAWRPPAEPFRLVTSAQAFHWVTPEVRFQKAAAVLRTEGPIALFGNVPVPQAGPLHASIQRAYAQCAPTFHARLPGSGRDPVGRPMRDELADAPEFGPVLAETFAWQRDYDADRYGELMQTQSDHQLLPPDELMALVDAVRERIARHGGTLRIHYEARLLLARRRRCRR